MAQTSNNTDVFAQTVAGGGSSSTVFDGFFGDGSDGDVVITTTVTLTVDRYYNNLTIDTGGTLKPRGQHVFVKNVLTINPGVSINDDGVAGGTGASGGTALSSISNGFGAGSGAGGAGRTTTGPPVTRVPRRPTVRPTDWDRLRRAGQAAGSVPLL